MLRLAFPRRRVYPPTCFFCWWGGGGIEKIALKPNINFNAAERRRNVKHKHQRNLHKTCVSHIHSDWWTFGVLSAYVHHILSAVMIIGRDPISHTSQNHISQQQQHNYINDVTTVKQLSTRCVTTNYDADVASSHLMLITVCAARPAAFVLSKRK